MKVYLQTWGCQMNAADSLRMEALLIHHKYTLVDAPDNADIMLLNTCHIREKAYHRVVSRIGELIPFKEKNNAIIGIAGCVAQAESKKLSEESFDIDLIFGPDHIEELPTLLEDALKKKSLVKQVQWDKDPSYHIPIDVIPPLPETGKTPWSPFINIIKGCNNFCTFCVVPYTRGREKSRSVEEILGEVQYYLNRGSKEITLLGQNVNSYGQDKSDDFSSFVDLLYQISKFPELKRLRFTTSNPHDFTQSLAQAFHDIPILCDHFHLPVQSGSDHVLGRMKRQYTQAAYLQKVSWLKEFRPNMAFSTDIIVGFPGETDADFQETLSLMEKMEYSFVFAFKYSPRKGTPATRFTDIVDEKIQTQRLYDLFTLQNVISCKKAESEVNQVFDVYFLYAKYGYVYGRTSQSRLVKISDQGLNPSELLGKILPVKIIDIHGAEPRQTSLNAISLLGILI